MREIIAIDQNTWRIEDEGVRFFLLEGEETALLVDSGMKSPDAAAVAAQLTQKPLRLLNTHADPDHISGNGAFASFYLHPAERENYAMHRGTGESIPVRGGDTLELGGRTLRILELPGHTPGSIAVLDEKNRVLIGGDAIQDGRIFMFGPQRNMAHYIESLRALWADHGGEFDVVYPSHGSFPVQPALIPALAEAAEQITAGRAEGTPIRLWGKEVLYYDMGCAGFLCDPKQTGGAE